MDRRSIIGLVLISIVVIGWLVYQSVTYKPVPKELKQDTTARVQEEEQGAAMAGLDEVIPSAETEAIDPEEKYGRYFSEFASGAEKIITIETDLYEARLSNKGGVIKKWKLKDYNKWDGVPTQLIQDQKGELFLTFLTMDNKKIDTRDLYFEFTNVDKAHYIVGGDSKLEFTARLEVEPGSYIEKKFIFHGNKYHLDNDITLNNMAEYIPSRGYNYVWDDGLRYQEYNSVDESAEAQAMASMNGEIAELDASDPDESVSQSESGIVDYAAVKIKYFEAAIIPEPWRSFDGTVDMYGERELAKNEGVVEKYSLSFRVPYTGASKTNSFKVYIGPIDYDIVSDYGLSETVNFGLRFIVRPIGEYFMLPILTFIHEFIPNYGVAIIVFSVLIKVLLYPLSVTQMRSAQKMQLLSPEMTKLRDKYKDDQTQQQKEMMKLYSEYGINPMGGCLPLILQMPILYSLWSLLRTSIDLRQADFFLWINDLSTPDVIIDLGFKIPLIGMDKVSGLALLMGITLYFQQKLTITDPRQKQMVVLMPILFTIMFSHFPAGLNLYYFIFNLIGIAMQVYINKFSKNKVTLEDLKRMPKKEGWLQKKMREAQEMAESQGRSVPGKTASGEPARPSKTKYARKKKKK
ncbi:MAG: membrane protein insertase YidC [Candidatus Kapaibacterium sp.]